MNVKMIHIKNITFEDVKTDSTKIRKPNQAKK